MYAMTLRPLAPHLNAESWRDAAANRLEEVDLMADLERSWTQWIVEAGAIWNQTQPAVDSLVATYLATFGVRGPLPATVRYHPDLLGWPKNTPAMVSLVASPWDGAPLGVHRTRLARDGSGRAAVESPEAQTGYTGYNRSGVVRLAEPGDTLIVGTSIESSLLAMEKTGLPAWAMPSDSGWSRFVPPGGMDPRIRDILLLVDSRDVRCPKVRSQVREAVQDAIRHWKRQGRRVYILDTCPACLPQALPARLRGAGKGRALTGAETCH
jgi:putative DNA primase/helicase